MNVYVNLDISTLDADGTELDPVGWDQWKTNYATNPEFNEDMTYRIKGDHTYNDHDNIVVSVQSSYIVRLEAWGNLPPRIKVFGSYGSLRVNGGQIELDRIMIESYQALCTFTIPAASTKVLSKIENCFFRHSNFRVSIESSVSGVNVKGNSFLKVGDACAITFESSFTNSAILVDSNYIEMPDSYNLNARVIETYRGTITYRNNMVKRANLPFQGWERDLGQGTFINGGGNVDPTTESNLSQLVNMDQPIMNMILPDDLLPIENSEVIDAGDPALGLSTDLFNVTRTYDPNPDIGAAEGVSATPVINSFDAPPERNGALRISTVNTAVLLGKISNAYFDNASTIKKVVVTYTHTGGESVRIVHRVSGSNIVGRVAWGTDTLAGTWNKTKAVVHDMNDAVVTLEAGELVGEELILA